jgi:hypothetical protein
MEWTKIHSHSQQYTTTSKRTQSTSSHHTSLQSILILYAHLCLGLSGLLPSGFLTEVGYISHLTVLDYLVTHTHIQTPVIIVFSFPPLSFLLCPNTSTPSMSLHCTYITLPWRHSAEMVQNSVPLLDQKRNITAYVKQHASLLLTKLTLWQCLQQYFIPLF